MGILKWAWQESRGAENKFRHRAVLFIPSESYCAATITIMEGLQELGWCVYTIGKPNINSWFVNEVVQNPNQVKFDFVLSNLHWGNRWDLYDTYNLLDKFKVLIDGCDNRQCANWKEKYDKYCGRYPSPLTNDVKAELLQPSRWMESLHGYKPDLVFTSQRPPGDKTVYLPFGIHHEYLGYAENKTCAERRIDFANFPGPGTARIRLTNFLNGDKLPGIVHNAKVGGVFTDSLSPEVRVIALRDGNAHSWHRWFEYPDYFKALNDTKVLIYPNVYSDIPHWDSKRVWEGYASGCLILLEKPNVDMAEYPVTELCKEAMFSSYDELVERARWLHADQGRLERFRLESTRGALKYFAPKPMARRFLFKVWEAMND